MGVVDKESFKLDIMRVSFIIESFRRGGKERRCLQLIQGLNKAGFRDIQVIFVNNNIEYPEIYDTDADIKIIGRKDKGLSHIQTYKAIKKSICEFKPDIVQAWGELSMMYVSLIRLTYKFKYICSNVADCNRLSTFSTRNIICRFSYCLADSVVGNSKAGLRAYNAPKSKAKCIYNGFNESRFALAENADYKALKADLKIDTEYLVAMFARVDYYKDPDAFIALANRVLETRDDVTFLVVGKGLYYDKYKDINGPKNRLRFIGFRSDVEPLMAMTNVSILFSNYKFHQEGVSNSIMESMAFGTPVIATNGGGSPEIIEDGVNGFLVNENNIEDSSRILCRLLDDPSELKHISKNAKSTIQDRFLLSTMVANYLELYRKLLS